MDIGKRLVVVSVVGLLIVSAHGNASGFQEDTRPPLNNEQFQAALKDAAQCTSIKEVFKRAGSANYNNPAIHWHLKRFALNALLTPPKGNNSRATYNAVLNLYVYTTALELEAAKRASIWPESEGLKELSERGIQALRKRTGYPDPKDGVLKLLDRKPEVEPRSLDGSYYQYRFLLSASGEEIVQESVSEPVAGLSPKKVLTRRKLKADEVPEQIEGSFYTFQLGALFPIITAAKICLCDELVGKTPDSYISDIFLGTLFLKAAEHQGEDFGPISAYSHKKALDGISKDDPDRAGLAKLCRAQRASAFFFATQLLPARRAYAELLENTKQGSIDYTTAAWGIAVCELGISSPEAGKHCKLYSDVSNRDSDIDVSRQYILASCCRLLSKEQMGVCAPEAAWYDRMRGTDFGRLGPNQRYNYTLAASSVLRRIDKWEVLSRLLLDELKYLDGIDTDEAVSHRLSHVRTLYLILREEGFPTLSWEKDAKGKWVIRDKAQLEKCAPRFAPYWARGQDPRVQSTRLPRYGMNSWEEDLATCTELYGLDVSDNKLSGIKDSISSPPGMAADKDTRQPVATFRMWIEEELKRDPPNTQPLIKLAWIEWFFVPITLQGFSVSPSKTAPWKYIPADQYGLTAPKTIWAALAKTRTAENDPVNRFYFIMEGFHDYLVSASAAGRFTLKKGR